MQLQLSCFEDGFSQESIEVQVHRKDLHILVGFHFSSPRLSEFYLPEPALEPGQKTGLWRRTCFETFFGFHDQNSYLEFNFSPTLDWDQMYFSDYRVQQDFKHKFVFRCETLKTENTYDFAIHFSRELLSSFAFDCVFPTAIMEHNTSGIGHWAPKHFDKPDFHRKENFIAF